MLLVIASYGLRGCEVRALRLNDIDWAHDEIVIFAPKTGRRRALPLTRPAGEAVLDYLLAERPPSRHREVFLSSRPPHGPLRSKINPWLGRQLEAALASSNGEYSPATYSELPEPLNISDLATAIEQGYPVIAFVDANYLSPLRSY